MKLVNMNKILTLAHQNKYAVPHININNLEWTKSALQAAQENNSPIILGVSVGAIKYMGGPNVVKQMVFGLFKDLKITVPVVLHLDHGTYDMAFKCINAGFTSIMYDGSHESFTENYKKTKVIIEEANRHNISVECEVGTIGGEEDGVIGAGEVVNIDEFKKIALLKPSALAAGINNVHGKYPPNWKGLRFDVLQNLQKVSSIPMVLHGGSGIPIDQVKKSITMGIAKINVNTECQLAFSAALSKYFHGGNEKIKRGYDPRKILAPGCNAIKEVIKQKMIEFGSINKV